MHEEEQPKAHFTESDLKAAQLAAIVDSSDDAIIGKDLNGIVTSWNRAAEKIFGYTAAEMIGSSIRRLIPADRHEEEDQILAKVRRGEKVQLFETKRQTKDGRTIDVSVMASPIKNAAGQTIGVSKVAHDITARMQAEAIVRQAAGDVARDRSRQVRIDLAIFTLLTGLLYTLALTFSWFEAITRWFLAHDVEKLDEIIVCALFITTGLAVFSYRRWREAKLEMASRQQVQAAVGRLHAELERRVKQRTEALRASEDRYRTLFEWAPDGILIADPQGTYLDANESICRMLGYAQREIIGLHVRDIVAPTEIQHIASTLAAIKTTRNHQREWQFRRKDDSVFPGEVMVTLMPDGNLLAMVRDVTERKQAEAALRESNRRFNETLENIALIAMTLDKNGVVTFCNDFLLRLTGWKREEVIGHSWFDRFLPESAASAKKLFLETIDTGQIPPHYQNPITTRTGELREIVWNNTVLRNGAGDVVGTASIGEDVTERARAEAEVRESQLKFASAFANNPAAIALMRLEDGRALEVNDTWVALCGYSREEIIGRPVLSVWPTPEAAKRFVLELREKGVLRGREQEFRKKTGEIFVAEVSSQVLTMGSEQVILSTLVDITARKQAQQAVRSSEERFRQVVENIHEVFWMTDPAKNQVLYISPAYEKVWGRTVESLYAEPQSWLESIYPEDRERVTQAMVARQVRGDYDETYRIHRADGALRWIRDRAFPIRDQGGEVYRVVGTAEDVTEYRTLEEQFRQAQKMEAIGTLAGGIAHDFNNILAAINGYTELSRLILKENPEVRTHLGAVLQASSRATDLIRQILTFSRQERQERRAIQLRTIVAECFGLLRATLPTTIEFDLSLATDAPVVLADPTQVHQILMNLGTNAWHAMKERPGRLQVKLERCVVDEAHAFAQSQLRPGLYARISVSDSGCGMDQATLRRIFEPFFTTKAPGEGTGLGLSVVHGIMDSHDGAVTVYSQPGEGTVFHLYFPAHAGEGVADGSASEDVPLGHGERILFVDDEELLVRLGQKALGAIGYEVETATQPAVALAMVRADPQRFAVVLTDYTMSGMTGLTLAKELLQIRPELPIILMTGYAASLTPDRVKAAGIHQLLLKPATLHTLGKAVYSALSQKPTH